MSASAVKPGRSASSGASPRKAKSTNDEPSAQNAAPATVARTLTGFNGNRRVPPPVNEPVKSYAPGSPERAALKERPVYFEPYKNGPPPWYQGAMDRPAVPRRHGSRMASRSV